MNDFVIENGILLKYTGSDKSIHIPDGVRSIGVYAFMNCLEINEVYFSSGVEEIEYGAFHNCKSLRKISFVKGPRIIRESAFEFCKSLTELSIPDGLEEIERRAFFYCVKLSSLDLPSTLKKIGAYAFQYAPLTNLELNGASCVLQENQFDSFPPALMPHCGDLCKYMGEGLLIHLMKFRNWDDIDKRVKAKIFLCRQSKKLSEQYKEFINEIDVPVVADYLLEKLSEGCTKKEYNAIANFLLIFGNIVSDEKLQEVFFSMKAHKGAVTALKSIEADGELLKRIQKK